MIKKITLLFLILIVILTALNPIYASEQEADYSGHWAENTIQKWLDNDYVKGYPNGSFNPDGLVTRAEFVKMINTSFGYTDSSEISFRDVAQNQWYYNDVQIAFKAGYISGISKDEFAPTSNITREQAAVIISKILNLELSASGAEKFSDNDDISAWAWNYVGSAANEQLILGYTVDNSFKPKNSVKRAEAIEMLDRALDRALLNVQPADLVVDAAGTIIENKTVNNLHITKKVGDGNVTLKNVTIKGELLVEGGGQNSIILDNSSINKLTANKTDGKVRISLEGDTNVESTSVKTNIILEQEKLNGKSFEKIALDLNSEMQIQTSKKITLTSSDKEVATISSDGIVTAKNPGVASITTNIEGKKTKVCEITVIDPASRTIKILSVGNSFSQDTLYYLYDIAKSANINVVVGNIYSSGCSLERHWNYSQNDENAYTYYKWTSEGMETRENYTMNDIILDEDWDYITFQQSSGESGIYNSYQPYLNNLITHIKGIIEKPSVKFALNMTWSYSYRSLNPNFYYYRYDQRDMYNAIVNAYEEAAYETDIDIIIPCGTAIQNARTNKNLKAVGNELTSDGHHLDTGIGRYIAGLTIFKTIINEENIERDLLKDITFIPETKKSDVDLPTLAKKAVISAIEEPFSITTIK